MIVIKILFLHVFSILNYQNTFTKYFCNFVKVENAVHLSE